jgi:hypothetical protein
MSMLFIWRNDFDAGTIRLRGPLKGVGPEIETFWSPEIATSKASAIFAQKISFPSTWGD